MEKLNIKWESLNLDDLALESHGVNDLMDDDDEFNSYEQQKMDRKFAKLPKIVPTPFGLCRVDDKMNPLARFKFWVGHTNFKINHLIKDKIRSVPGVEVLDIDTPYRFKMAVGQMFEDKNVRIGIEQAICGKHKFEAALEKIYDEQVREKVVAKREELKVYPYWCFYLFPNGEIHAEYTADKSEYDQKYAELVKAKELSKGPLFSYNDE